MIKVVQFGEGNFLRTFADAYFNELNKEGGKYCVDIVKPIPFGNLDNFVKQDNKYHIVLRGMKNGKCVEEVYKIDVLNSVVSPFENFEEYNNLALDKDLKIIVSNTTEAGICYNGDDKNLPFDKITYPAKLTKFLYNRFKAGFSGVYILPIELIDCNADMLYKCVDNYIKLFDYPNEFKVWNDTENFYCNTLVDRIVSGHPRDEKTLNHLFDLIGEKDELVSVGEPFGLWAIEDKGEISKYIKDGHHNIDVVLTKNIEYYKKRKVRVLNGSHTNIVPVGLWHGAVTVDDCMKDKRLNKFLSDTLENEINPFVSDDITATKYFADSVKERFCNPFLNHELISISLNSISKWRARDLFSFSDYYEKHGKLAPNLTIGFSYLMAIYSSAYKKDGGYFVDLPTRTVRLMDDEKYLEYFANGGSIEEFMKNTDIFGVDLSEFGGFVESVTENVKAIKKGKDLL